MLRAETSRSARARAGRDSRPLRARMPRRSERACWSDWPRRYEIGWPGGGYASVTNIDVFRRGDHRWRRRRLCGRAALRARRRQGGARRTRGGHPVRRVEGQQRYPAHRLRRAAGQPGARAGARGARGVSLDPSRSRALPSWRPARWCCAWTDVEAEKLEGIAEKGRQNGVRELNLLSAAQARAMAPGSRPTCARRSRWRASTSSIHGRRRWPTSPGDGERGRGPAPLREVAVGRLRRRWLLGRLDRARRAPALVINAAGLYGDMVDEPPRPGANSPSRPRKGQFVVLDKPAARAACRISSCRCRPSAPRASSSAAPPSATCWSAPPPRTRMDRDARDGRARDARSADRAGGEADPPALREGQRHRGLCRPASGDPIQGLSRIARPRRTRCDHRRRHPLHRPQRRARHRASIVEAASKPSGTG